MAVIKRKGSKYWNIVLWKEGKHHWYSTGTEDKLEAQRQEIEMKSLLKKKERGDRLHEFFERVSGEAIQKQGFPLASVWDTLTKLSNQKELKPRTIASKKIIWKNFCDWLKDNHPRIQTINEIDRNIAVQYSEKLSEKSPQTYNNHKHNLHGIFKAITHSADLKENPFDVVPTKTKKVPKSYRPLTLLEVKKLLKAAPSHWVSAVQISFYTGLRYKDVCFLKWDNVDLNKDFIELVPEKTSRTGKKVVIPINPNLKTILQKMKIGTARSAYIIPYMAKKYNTKNLQSAFSTLLSNCKIKDTKCGVVGFHSLRHTFVTNLEDSGTQREVSQKLVGHGSPLITDIYSHGLKQMSKAIQSLPKI